jgi:signal transduction histidine kinase/ligand-binding sensor domain-containing protein/CheY-like chemotaxis protein
MTRLLTPLRIGMALVALCAPVWAQHYNFKFYGEDEGLRNLVVQIVVQDRAGFLWTGTQNGLYRYDGTRFTTFSKNDGLPGTRIESMHVAADGTLWVGTRAGLARKVRERFEVVPMRLQQGGMAEGIGGRQGIATDAKGFMYLATERGLVRGTPKSGFELVKPPDSQRDQPVASVFLDASGKVWFGCGTALCTLEEDGAHDVSKQFGLPPTTWYAILGSVDGDLWVRGDRDLYRRRLGAETFEKLPGLPETTNAIPTLALDPEERLLVPTDNGLALQTKTGWEIINVNDGLGNSDIATVVKDQEGSIWLGLMGSGLTRWLGYGEWQSWTEREGLSRSAVWSLAKDRDGKLWVGTRFGLNYADTRKDKIEWKEQRVQGVEFVRSVAPSADGSLWIAADAGGVVRLNPKSGQTRKYDLVQDTKVDALHILVDRAQRVWVSTREGLFRGIPGKGNEFQFEQLKPVGTDADETFVYAVEDAFGQVWVCGNYGLVRYSGDKTRRFTEADGLRTNGVAQAAPSPDGRSVWVGYRDAFGLTRLTFTNGGTGDKVHAEHWTASSTSGLRSDKTVFLGYDKQGRLWAGTDRGADVFDQTRWRHLGRGDGLIWDDCNTQAFLANEDGIWIGTSRGLSRYQPRMVPLPEVPPTVVFTSVRFGGQEWNGDSMVEIPYDQRTLSVHFAALTFAHESAVTYHYTIGGVAQETNDTDFTYLLPNGEHTLEVMAKTAQGRYSLEPAKLEFRIATPWFLSWWFRLGAVVVALIIGRVMWQRRTYRLEAERHRLERAVTARTHELSIEKARAEHETVVVHEQKVEIERLLVEAQQASKLKSEFLANMSHEIRTPMNGVLGMTDVVLGTELNPEQREYLEAARYSADSLLTIINDILDFSKIEAGRLDLNPIEFSLPECLEETAKIFTVPLRSKQLEYACEVAANVPGTLIGDPDRLRQVLLNLVGNAVKFTETGRISIRVRKEGDTAGGVTLHFEVRDTGIGIPADKCKVIFESFRQADGSTTRKYGGTGLGLTICSRLVELMGGTIWVESELGRGSAFQFTARFGLAASKAAEDLANMARAVAASAPAAPTETPARILHVLVAEDNVINQRLATRLLEKRGHKVKVTATGREALEILSESQFDVVLMDVQMPDMDGLQATALIREREAKLGTHTPIIALTAHTMKGDRERCLNAGMDDFITKPVNAVELIAVVESAAAAYADRLA